MSRTLPHTDVFLHQARQAEGRSPLYAGLCRRLATEPLVAEIVEPEPRWDAALRLLGGLHHLVLEDAASWEQPEKALAQHRDFLRRFVSEQRVQTNEVRRCWILLPCFLEAARRTGRATLDVVELGTSAGLLLQWHRLRYRYEAGTWGPDDSVLELCGEERRSVPRALLEQPLEPRERVGIDLDPVDVTVDEGARLLESFVWADRGDRIERLRQAIAVLRESPPRILRGDFVELLPGLLEERRRDGLTVVFQVAAGGYLDRERWGRLMGTLEHAGAHRPLAYVFTGKPEDGSDRYWGLWLTTWPGGEREQLAHADLHGDWIEWLAR